MKRGSVAVSDDNVLAHMSSNTDWMVEIFESWATMDFNATFCFAIPDDWFRVINYSRPSTRFIKTRMGFSQNFKSWLSKILEQTELKNFDTKNNTRFLARGIVQIDAKIWANDCSTTRFIYTFRHTLLGVLGSRGHQEIFDEGIDASNTFSSLMTMDVYPCWAMRGSEPRVITIKFQFGSHLFTLR